MKISRLNPLPDDAKAKVVQRKCNPATLPIIKEDGRGICGLTNGECIIKHLGEGLVVL